MVASPKFREIFSRLSQRLVVRPRMFIKPIEILAAIFPKADAT
jgi:hypothetical protein